MSTAFAEAERLIREQTEQNERVLASLQLDLRATTAKLDMLAQKHAQYDILATVCKSLEDLEDLGASHLFWGVKANPENVARFIRHAQREIDEYKKDIERVENLRQTIIDKIGDQTETLDSLHYELHDAIAEEESRQAEWVVEREANDPAYHRQIMPWAREAEEDERYRRTLVTSVVASIAIMLLVGLVTVPIIERTTVQQLPERVAKLVREERLPPAMPEAIQEPAPVEEEVPEPELAEEVPEQDAPESVEKPVVADASPAETKERVRSKGILAFRDSFANRASLGPGAQLGSQARVSNAGTDTVGRPERSMVTTTAPGSSGGINLSDISRNVGGGGQGIGGVEVTRVASSIGTGDGPARPLSGGASAGRTDEEIQIVFDRYKAALYRLYNRALRQDPTLRGQMVLRLTIEPDGSVSLCQLQSSDMNAPALAREVVDRVLTFDFGAKEDIVAMTIIYPIDFLPAA